MSVLLLTCAAAVCACLSMDRHHRAVFGMEPTWQRRRLLRSCASLLLAIAYGAAVIAQGPGIGSVEWICALGLGAVGVSFVLPYKPQWVPYLGAAAAFAGVLTMVR